MTVLRYTELPGDVFRPLIDVTVGGSDIGVKGLLDTGAVNTIFGTWVADESGIDLEGADERTVGVGGMGSQVAHFATVPLSGAGLQWEASVGFVDSWKPGWGLLDHTAVLRFFKVTFRSVDLEFEMIPNQE